jgi:carbonic anhydrase
MTTIDNVIEFNKRFVANKGYESFVVKPRAEKKIAIVSCMDTRLVEMLPAALGIQDGQAKLIKNAGAVITHPNGSVMRSLIVAVYALGVREIMIVGHTDCGMKGLDLNVLRGLMAERGINTNGIDMDWLRGFDNDTESVRASVNIVRTHPLLPADIPVRGFIIDVSNGELKEVK